MCDTTDMVVRYRGEHHPRGLRYCSKPMPSGIVVPIEMLDDEREREKQKRGEREER